MDQIEDMDEVEYETEDVETEDVLTEEVDEQPSDDEVSLDFDMESVPEHMRPMMESFRKDILRGMNKKYQGWADERKSLQQKAEAFDQILNDPQKRKVFMASLKAMDGDDGNGGGTPASGPSFNIHPDDVYEQLDESYRAPIEAAIGKYLDQYLAPALKPYQDAIVQIYRDRQSGEWSKLEEKYPGASEHRAKAEEVASKAGIPVEQALFAVMGDKLLQSKAPVNGKPKTKKPGPLTKHNVVPASRAPVIKNGNSREASIANVAALRRSLGIEY